MDRDRVLKTLHQRRCSVKSSLHKQISDLPLLVTVHKVQIVIGNGGKLRYCQDRASWKTNMDLLTGEIEGRSSQFQMIVLCLQFSSYGQFSCNLERHKYTNNNGEMNKCWWTNNAS